ncbi:phosphoribosyltransferase [Micromonospora sp. NPDC005806]|uniref:phosphoribosyltransferase n=1 Tax=Micromonospora sp. NPDC005806 TaxID=3364234 RepID=UPI0036759BDE
MEATSALTDEASVYAPLFQALEDVPSDVHLGILDLSVSTRKINTELFLRPKAVGHICSAIVTTFASGTWNSRRLVVLLPVQQMNSDDLRRVLGSYLESGKVVLLSDDGRSSWIEIDDDDYQSALALLRTAPIDRFERKLITRLGWFRPHAFDGETRVLRHYFDAQKAADELGELLDAYIGVGDSARRPDLIAYHESASSWLTEPLRGTCIRADDLPILSVDEWSDPSRDVSAFQRRSVLLVVPLLHGGESLIRKIGTLEERLGPHQLTILAVLCADGGEPRHGSRRIAGPGGRTYTVDYFLSVRQLMESERSCRLAVFGETKRYAELTDSLTTGEFWDLVRLCGTKPEDNVPEPRRGGLPVVPNLPRMLELYGNWLAYKLWMSIQKRSRTVGQDMLLVCPEGERGSGKVSQLLSLWSGARVVRIPRDTIESVASGTPATDVFDDALPWCQELASVARREVVLVDDFVRDGHTMRAMETIAKGKGLSVTAVCVLVDFAPQDKRSWHSLYSWQPREKLEVSSVVPGPRTWAESISAVRR